jgi:hypothetical protein
MMSKKIAILASLAVILVSAATASAASANPAWEFNGTALTGTEAVLGISISSTLSVPGAPVTCGHLQLFMKISNAVAPGQGEVTKLLPYECTATASCTVQSIAAEKLPWPAHTKTITGKSYVIIEKVQIGIEFGGETCPLAEALIVIKGTAGGLFENTTSTLTFNKASFEATSTSLKTGATNTQWTGIFPMEALGVHSGEALEVG